MRWGHITHILSDKQSTIQGNYFKIDWYENETLYANIFAGLVSSCFGIIKDLFTSNPDI